MVHMFTKKPENTEPITVGDGSSAVAAPSGLRQVIGTVAMFASALLLTWVLLVYVFQLYAVSGQSMETTFHDQDRLIVWKVPRTIARFTGHNYVPNRGDVVIVNTHGVSGLDAEGVAQIIKRVIALPGERVVVKNGIVTVYNSEHPSGFVPDTTLPYGETTSIPYSSGDVDVTLSDNEFFICGDNRGNSYDSREIGPVNLNRIIGKVVFRVYPLGDAGVF